MLLAIADVLDAARLAAVREHLAAARFVDGGRTAGWHARDVKDNAQAAAADPATRAAATLVRDALLTNPVFRAGVLPRRLRPVRFARYDPGEGYGAHLDDALMGDDDPLRTDVAVTVFLSAPEDYAGGELVLETTGGEHAHKLGAGAALAYPATTSHRVATVTAGQRLVAVTWAQCLVRDAARRELLFELDTARRDLFTRDGHTAAFGAVARSHANLLRMWAEP